MVIHPESALDQIRLIFERFEKWRAIFTQENMLALEDEVVDYTNLTSRTKVRVQIGVKPSGNPSVALAVVYGDSLVVENLTDVRQRRANPSLWHTRTFGHLYRQRLIKFVDHGVHLVAEELVHPTQAALGVEGGHFEVVTVEVEGGGDVVTDHA